MTQGREITRRAALRTLGTGAGTIAFLPWLSDEGALAFTSLKTTGARPALKVLTAAQYATTEALVEAIIPTDERSPGAKEARVADYIDLLLSESSEPPKKEWLDGLTALDAESVTRFKAPFLKLEPGQVETLLTEISQFEIREAQKEAAEKDAGPPANRSAAAAEKPTLALDLFGGVTEVEPDEPRTPLEKFFAVTKSATIQGYYRSEIGIHKELKYKGNQVIAEFVGCLTEDGKDCPHCGQKAQA